MHSISGFAVGSRCLKSFYALTEKLCSPFGILSIQNARMLIGESRQYSGRIGGRRPRDKGRRKGQKESNDSISFKEILEESAKLDKRGVRLGREEIAVSNSFVKSIPKEWGVVFPSVSSFDELQSDEDRYADMTEPEIEEERMLEKAATETIREFFTSTVTPRMMKMKDASFPTDPDLFFSDGKQHTLENYNILLSKMAVQGKSADAFNLITVRMPGHELTPDGHSFSAVIKACTNCLDANTATSVIAMMEHWASETFPDECQDGRLPDKCQWAYSEYINTLMNVGEFDRGIQIAKSLPTRGLKLDNVVYTILIKGAAINSRVEDAWALFKEMRVNGVEPDFVTFSHMIYLCTRNGEAEKAFNFKLEMKQLGIQPTEVTLNNLILACARRADYVEEAFSVFNEYELLGYEPDAYTFYALLRVASNAGDVVAMDRALALMQRAVDRANNGSSLSESEKTSKSLRLTSPDMLEVYNSTFITPKDVDKLVMSTLAKAQRLVSRTNALSQSQNIDRAAKLIEKISIRGEKPSLDLMNQFVEVNAAALRLRRAQHVMKSFDSYGLKPDEFTYSRIIVMFLRARRVAEAAKALEEACNAGLSLTPLTYKRFLVGCMRDDDLKLLRFGLIAMQAERDKLANSQSTKKSTVSESTMAEIKTRNVIQCRPEDYDLNDVQKSKISEFIVERQKKRSSISAMELIKNNTL